MTYTMDQRLQFKPTLGQHLVFAGLKFSANIIKIHSPNVTLMIGHRLQK